MDLAVIPIIILVAFGIVVIFINKKFSDLKDSQKPSEELLAVIKMLQSGSKEDRKVLLDSLQKNTQSMNERLDNAARVIAAVQRNLGEMSEVGKSIRSLQEFLQSPKLRGNLGEEVLKEMIGQAFPKNAFHLQYSFKSGAKVDAVLKTEAGLLCIDSKFPMENFNAMVRGETEAERTRAKRNFAGDVKKHIEAIAKKYIMPKVLKEVGLKPDQFIIRDEIWQKMVRPLGFDAGIRTLQRTIQGAARKAARIIVEGKYNKVEIGEENYKIFLPTY